MSAKNWRSQCKNHLQNEELKPFNQYDQEAEQLFPLQVPSFFKNNIDLQNENDPLLLQVMPDQKEHQKHTNYSDDPVGDLLASPAKGVIHKYHGRVLLITNGQCAINCRYCFRRNFAYNKNHASGQNWATAIEYIQEKKDIHEVILSGGDPLMLSTKALQKLSHQLETIPHVNTIRIHTRIPIVAPNRINHNFLTWLNNIKLKKVMVVHCNHANELTEPLKQIFTDIKTTSTLLLNQSVLLKNINDDAQILANLSHKLFDFGILPYYLNQLDQANGTAHFSVSRQQALSIHRQLMATLPGYLTPKLVEEISGKKNKTPIF